MVHGLPWWQAVFVLVPWALVPTAGSQFGGRFGGGFVGAVLAGVIGGGIGGGSAMLCSILARRPGKAGTKVVSLLCVNVIAYAGFFGVTVLAGSALRPAPVPLASASPTPASPSPQPTVTLSMPASCPHTTGPASTDAALALTNAFGFSAAPGNEIDGGRTVQALGPGAFTVSATPSGVRAGTAEWTVELGAARGGTLGCGTYRDALESTRGAAPYISVSGSGHHCGSARGTFTIYQIGFTPQGTVGLLNANFTQRCTPRSAPLVGYVRFGDTGPAPMPGLPSTALPITAPEHEVTTSANADEFYTNSFPVDGVGQRRHADVTGDGVVVTGRLDRVEVRAAGWTVDLAPKRGEHLAPGTYVGTLRDNSGSAPELSVKEESGSCDGSVYGTFTVYQVSADANGAITALNATFSQSCGTPSTPPLVGYIRFHATAPTPVPTLPAGLRDPATPPATSGTASKHSDEFRVDSAPGDAVGRGQKTDITGSKVTVEGSLGLVLINPGQGWSLRLMAPEGKQLAPGTYVTSAPDAVTDVGGIEVSGPGGGCGGNAYSTVTIYQVASRDGAFLSQLNASFSQTCALSSAPPLVGFIRFNATKPTPIPVLDTSSWSQPGAPLSP
ncbi:hypothetical protein [Streptomyces sp. NPDC020983]|uniref:hypothetical protein n=1 Tax=Streptomyces sp. NPDC020983 TaxID=3365106 RepID=UPI0037A63F4C